jgi:hypothetical protein
MTMKTITSITAVGSMISSNHLNTLLLNGRYNAVKDRGNNLLVIEGVENGTMLPATDDLFIGTVYGPDMKKHCAVQMTASDIHSWGGFTK